MNRDKIKITTVQMCSIQGNICDNLQLVRELCQSASIQNTKVICFPELAIPGAGAENADLSLYDSSDYVPGVITNKLSEIAKDWGLYIVIGVSQRSRIPGRLFNTLVVFSPEGKIKEIYQKINLEGKELLYWKSSITKELKYVDFPFGKAGFLLGTDVNDEEIIQRVKEKNIKMIFIPSHHERKSKIDKERLREVARETGAYLFVPDNTESLILSPKGRILAESQFRDEMVDVELERKLLKEN